jgi:hypothetical protein
MQNFTFFEVSNYFSYFYSLLLIYSIGKGFKLEKSSWAAFSAAGPARCRPQPISTCKAGLLRLLPRDAAKWVPAPREPHMSASLCCDTAGRRQPNSRRWAIHPSPPRATRMTACPPATLSHRVSRGAPWRPITAARLRLLLAALPANEIPATPRAKVLHPSLCELPSHPFTCRLTCEPLASRIATKASHQSAALVDRYQGRYAATMPAPSTRRQGLT